MFIYWNGNKTRCTDVSSMMTNEESNKFAWFGACMVSILLTPKMVTNAILPAGRPIGWLNDHKYNAVEKLLFEKSDTIESEFDVILLYIYVSICLNWVYLHVCTQCYICYCVWSFRYSTVDLKRDVKRKIMMVTMMMSKVGNAF